MSRADCWVWTCPDGRPENKVVDAERIVAEMFADGFIRDIARAAGVSERTVYRIAERLGLKRDEGHFMKAQLVGLRQIEYLRVIGRRMGPKKGGKGTPGSFRKGHRLSPEVEKRRVESIRRRARDERIRVERGWERKTAWPMKKKGGEE